MKINTIKAPMGNKKSINKALDKFKSNPTKEWKSLKKQEASRISGIKKYQ